MGKIVVVYDGPYEVARGYYKSYPKLVRINPNAPKSAGNWIKGGVEHQIVWTTGS